MRETPTRQQVLNSARELGAVPYRAADGTKMVGVSFTFEQLDRFVNKMINPATLVLDVSEGRPSEAWKGLVE